MSKNFKELREQNDLFEKKLNELTKEVRGYKDDAISEQARSLTNEWNQWAIGYLVMTAKENQWVWQPLVIETNWTGK